MEGMFWFVFLKPALLLSSKTQESNYTLINPNTTLCSFIHALTLSLQTVRDHSNPKLIIPYQPKWSKCKSMAHHNNQTGLIPVICLSLHPVRETLPSLLPLQPALCPLFNPAERPGTRGSKLISSGVRTHNAFVAVANVKLYLTMQVGCQVLAQE